MKINPIKEYKKPEYPNFEDFLSNSYSLSNYTPLKWRKNPLVWAAVVSILISNQSCNTIVDKNTRIEIIKSKINSLSAVNENYNVKVDSTFVAPIFEHGRGSGSYGCMIAQPPHFLNELDAKLLILNEFKKNGIEFDTLNQPGGISGMNLQFDGYNSELNLGFHFISYRRCPRERDDDESSVYELCPQKEATRRRNELKKNADINAVVFYDPLAEVEYKSSSRFDKREQKQLKKSKALLKAQVNDFIEWFKYEKLTK